MHTWDLYEITCDADVLHGVKLRGRIRKFSIENSISCLMENASDKENTVRFALTAGSDSSKMTEFIQTLLPNASITPVLTGVANPVLSKLNVNDVTRYEI